MTRDLQEGPNKEITVIKNDTESIQTARTVKTVPLERYQAEHLLKFIIIERTTKINYVYTCNIAQWRTDFFFMGGDPALSPFPSMEFCENVM